MTEPRDRRMMVNIEQSVAEKLEMLISKEEVPASTYIRSLIIADLIARGLITNEDLLALAAGIR